MAIAGDFNPGIHHLRQRAPLSASFSSVPMTSVDIRRFLIKIATSQNAFVVLMRANHNCKARLCTVLTPFRTGLADLPSSRLAAVGRLWSVR